MSGLKTIVLLACVAACGRQIVEFKDDAGGPGQDSGVDAHNARLDAGVDAIVVNGAAPTVIANTPATGAVLVARNATLSATFSEAMDASTITSSTFTLTQSGAPIAGVVGLDGPTRTAMLVPSAPLGVGLIYTATITTGATSAGHRALAAEYSWTFMTGATLAASPPTVIFTSPANLATDVSISAQPTATFSEAMNPATLTALTFTLADGATPVLGTVTYDAATNTAKLSPTTALALSTTYTGTISTGATNADGTALAASYTWTFTTGACSQTGAQLGSAATFAVLGGTMVTNTGLTALTGDLGVSPGTAITGFPPGTLVGTEHAGDAAAAAAHASVVTALADLSTRMLCVQTIIGDLGGQTLTPGLYKAATSIALTGNVTLDAQGDVNAVFVLQTGTALTVSTASQVILTNGASAANVYWSIGSSATLGTASAFAGTILAGDSITLTTGATLTGRALASTGAVTLDANTVVRPPAGP